MILDGIVTTVTVELSKPRLRLDPTQPFLAVFFRRGARNQSLIAFWLIQDNTFGIGAESEVGSGFEQIANIHETLYASFFDDRDAIVFVLTGESNEFGKRTLRHSGWLSALESFSNGFREMLFGGFEEGLLRSRVSGRVPVVKQSHDDIAWGDGASEFAFGIDDDDGPRIVFLLLAIKDDSHRFAQRMLRADTQETLCHEIFCRGLHWVKRLRFRHFLFRVEVKSLAEPFQ